MKTPAIVTKILTDYYRYLATGVVVIVLAAGYLLLISPKIVEVRSTQVATRRSDEQRLKDQQSYAEDLQKSNATYQTLFPEATRTSINDFIPSDPDFPGLILTIKNIVSKSGMTLDSINVAQGGLTPVASGATATSTSGKTGSTATAQAATVGGVSVKTQDVTISVSGGKSYEAFKNLLTTIESSRRLFDVVSLSFSTPSSSTDTKSTSTSTASASWSLILRTYYLPTGTTK